MILPSTPPASRRQRAGRRPEGANADGRARVPCDADAGIPITTPCKYNERSAKPFLVPEEDLTEANTSAGESFFSSSAGFDTLDEENDGVAKISEDGVKGLAVQRGDLMPGEHHDRSGLSRDDLDAAELPRPHESLLSSGDGRLCMNVSDDGLCTPTVASTALSGGAAGPGGVLPGPGGGFSGGAA